MKKLSSKIFFTLFISLSTILFLITLTTNVIYYEKEKNNINSNIQRINNLIRKRDLEELNDNNNVVIDNDIYIALINNKKEVVGVISFNDNLNTSKIKKISKKIIKKKNNKGINVTNLYVSNYSYYYNDNYLILLSNNYAHNRLTSVLVATIMLFTAFLIIVIGFCIFITKWITKPVEDSFNSQKKFIEDTSHELKTPLAVIMASTDLIDKTKKNEKWIDNIKDETDNMNKLINNMLELSRTEIDTINEVKEIHNLSNIIKKESLKFESLMYEKSILLELNVEDNIEFLCDEYLIKEMVGILLDNAIKHAYKNSSIIVNLSKNKNHITFSVSNSGDVIPKEHINKIFDRFYRVDKARNRSESRYGLGLAILKNIVIIHNGKIDVISKDNKTSFIITF